ncbi:MAG TPA: rhamnulokinase family protein [Candidatus Aminicenantes bacterium]|nr:rhamnulokinase family protein [Candidatus Aminicenantes bacterium]HRY65308.1 rhamnulokinase family protein [Candidatus Aminicenantes bacterium]HRZ72224.1 rhamnulokinase family protein [Candidatus Aminicenantes bacterium]
MPHAQDAAQFLAFDFGAESGRAVLGALAGRRLVIHEVRRFANTPLDLAGHIHWNVYALFDEMKAAMRDAAAAIGARPASIGVDTWGVDFGLLAKDGSLLGLPFCYRDGRNAGAMEEYFRLVPRPALYEATGIQFMPFNTLFQIYAMVRERSPLLDAAADLLFMPDLFNYLLTGRKTAEATIASTSQCLDPRTRTWIPGLFQAMGLSKRILQDIVEPGTVLGELAEEVAGATGLRHVPVVATAGHDTAAAVAAVPAEGGRWAYISSGTWSLVGVEEKAPVISERSLEANFTNEGGVGGTIRFLKNVAGLWLVQGCRRAWSADDPVTYDELTRAAAEAAPFAVLVDPDDASFLNPPDMPGAIAAYCRRTKQVPPAAKGAIVRSLLESLALKYRSVIEQLGRILGHPIDRIHVIGGGSRNSLLCQLTADATGLPVVAGPAEATAIGNILVQALAVGRVASPAEIRAVVRESFELQTYDPAGPPDAWDRAAARFRDIRGGLTAPGG